MNTSKQYLRVWRTSTQILPVKVNTVNIRSDWQNKRQSIVIDDAIPHVVQFSRYSCTPADIHNYNIPLYEYTHLTN